MNYHIFLSFRGEDTRKSFTDHLYAALRQRGIVTFRDEEELERGEIISRELLKAIKESMFAIVVLSKHYASSSWCLDELHEIVESREDLDRTVLPVFYGVNPSDIRHQKGHIARAFEKHEKRFTKDKQKVRRWRRALTKVANIAGWDTRDKSEAKIIEEIVKVVWAKLCDELPSNFDHLVGIQSKVDEVISLLKIGLNHICFVGIWGMGGMGKTTLARVVYETIQSKFETSCFLANVRDELERKGLVYLQTKLLSRLLRKSIKIDDSHEGVKIIRNFLCKKKVLLILDDVSDKRQLRKLAGNKDWFGAGSKIIITTRDKHVLTEYERFKTYKIEILDTGGSLKLFCQKAFRRNHPKEGYSELSEKVVKYSGGLPLALEVLGSLLCERSRSEWRDILAKLKQNLSKDILETLRISFDELEDEEYKAIFLDIACFFNRYAEDKVIKIMENCGLHPKIGINVLVEKSLLSYISSKEGERLLYMHDVLQEMGRSIICQENDVSRRSRLWSQENIDRVLRGNNGTKKVQCIVLNLEQSYKANWHPDCFSRMSNLRLLNLSNVHLTSGLNSLPSALKVFIWERYAFEAMPCIDQLHELVDLKLHRSKIRQLWNGTVFLGRLKFINLSHSKDLTETPDLSGIPNLESLILEGCIKLAKIHDSIGQHKKLVKLNLKDCENLVTFPDKLEMNSLKEFILLGCSRLGNIPRFGKNMGSLFIFDARKTKIEIVPSSIIHLTNLQELSFGGCNSLNRGSTSFIVCHGRRIPILVEPKLFNSFLGFLRLKKLDLSFCNLGDGSIPDNLSGLSSLRNFDLRGNYFSSLPIGCISNLPNLEHFDLSNCSMLQSIPKLPPNVIRVYASCCPSMKPLKDVQHLFASPLSKHRSLVVHEDEVIFFHIQGGEIPTWFEQRKYLSHSTGENFFPVLAGPSISILVDVPYVSDLKNEWVRIAVCLVVTKRGSFRRIDWSFKALEDEGFLERKRSCYFQDANLYSDPRLYIAFFPFNTKNRWRHFRGEHRQLHLKIGAWGGIEDCGWRLIRS